MNRLYVALLASSLLAASACSHGTAKNVDSHPRPLELKTAVAEVRSVADTLSIPARIQADPARVVRVFPPAGGRLVRVTVRPGDSVSRGQVLAVLESSDVSQARSDLTKAQAEFERSQHSLQRSQLLLDHKVLSEREYEDTKAQQIEAASELARAKSRLQVLGANATGTDNEVAVKSPISGTVLDVGASSGELSKSTDNASPICTIADLSSVWIMGDVFEKDLPAMHVGQPIEFQVNAYPDRTWGGKITFIADAIDPATRAAKVRVISANPKHELKPEMFATLKVTRRQTQALVIPASALLHEGGDTTVMVKAGENNFERRLVTVKPLESDAVVMSGLKPGDIVVTEGAALLRSNGD